MASWKDLEGITLAEKFQLQNLLFEKEASACFATRMASESRPSGWLRLMLADSATEVRKLQHWQIAAGLSHPNLVEVWETGSTERGVTSMVYLLTEPVDENLEAVLRERPLNQLEARETTLSAAKALRYLHSKALVHGRVAPTAILAVGEQIKLSSDTIAPSVESGGVLSTGDDLRGLGDCIHAMFTQSPATDPEHLSAIPQPFRDIIRGCYGVNPNDPWTAERITSTLDTPRVVEMPVAARAKLQEAPPSPPPAGRKRSPAWLFVPLGVGAVFIVIFLALKPHPATRPLAPPAVNPMADALPNPTAATAMPSALGPPVAHPSRGPSVSPLGPPVTHTPGKTSDVTAPRNIWRVISYTYAKPDDTAKTVREINRKWPHLKAEQFSPNGSGPPYYVALGGRMTRAEALELRQQAISAGLPPDTFVRNFSK